LIDGPNQQKKRLVMMWCSGSLGAVVVLETLGAGAKIFRARACTTAQSLVISRFCCDGGG